MPMYIYGTEKLDTDSIKKWSSIAFWLLSEAIFLSMGIKPEKQSSIEDVTLYSEDEKENAANVFSDFRERQDFILRAILDNQLTVKNVSDDDGEREYLLKPIEFSKWALENLTSFPSDLYEAVVGDKLAAPSVSVEAVNQKMTKSLDPNSDDYHSILANTRWAPGKDLEAMAREYIILEISRVGCCCTHPKWEKRIKTEKVEDSTSPVGYSTPFNKKDFSNTAIKRAVKDAFMTVDKERFVTGGQKQVKCPVHDN